MEGTVRSYVSIQLLIGPIPSACEQSAMPYPDRVIDVHTHIFNANHLPMQGLILRYTGYKGGSGGGDGWREWLARVAARLIRDIIGDGEDDWLRMTAALEDKAGSAVGEAIMLNDMYLRIAQRASDAIEQGLRADSDDPTQRLEAAEATELLRNLVEIELAYERSETIRENFDRQAVVIPTRGEVDRAFHLLAESAAALSADRGMLGGLFFSRGALRWLLRSIGWLIEKWAPEDLTPFVEFVYRLLSSEGDNVRRIREYYRPDQNVMVLVHHMMDLELSYPDREGDPHWDLEIQLKRMEELQAHLGEELVGFAPLDPRRDWHDYAKRALEMGFTGFKFYPPMGYMPIGNNDLALDESCRKFFGFCISRGVPVFTHCTPTGFEACPGAGLMSDPRGWKRLLEDDDFRQLRLCLGHAGGGYQKVGRDFVSPGWYASQSEWNHADNFAPIVVELCKTYENVYCDFSYLHGLLDDAVYRKRFEENFRREWESKGTYAFSDKAMFGSDAHMPELTRKTGLFLAYFEKVFNNLPAEEFEKFCYGNAMNYLKLS